MVKLALASSLSALPASFQSFLTGKTLRLYADPPYRSYKTEPPYRSLRTRTSKQLLVSSILGREQAKSNQRLRYSANKLRVGGQLNKQVVENKQVELSVNWS